VNHVIQEIVADELERIEDDSVELLTVTGVQVDPDLRHAVVWLSSLSSTGEEFLAKHRVRLQGAIARQMRLKRTPELRFRADPAVQTAQRVEDILRGLEEDRE
jgi:ribosome-binding factor A